MTVAPDPQVPHLEAQPWGAHHSGAALDHWWLQEAVWPGLPSDPLDGRGRPGRAQALALGLPYAQLWIGDHEVASMRRQERRADPLAHSTCDPQERQAAAHYISASGLEQVAQAMRGPEGARIGQAIWVSSRTEIGMRLQRLTGQDPEPTELRDPSALERACTETAERLSLAERRVSARLAEHLAIWRQLEVSGRNESRAPEQTARASACLRGIYLCAEGALLIGEREDDQRRWQAGNEAGIWIDRPWIDAAQDRAGGDRLGYGVPPRQAAENRRLQATEDALRAEWPAACLRAAALRLT